MKGVVKQTLNKNYLFTNQSELSIFMIVVVANKPCMCDWTTRLNLNTSLMDVMVAPRIRSLSPMSNWNYTSSQVPGIHITSTWEGLVNFALLWTSWAERVLRVRLAEMLIYMYRFLFCGAL